jgi:hypothetical protein
MGSQGCRTDDPEGTQHCQAELLFITFRVSTYTSRSNCSAHPWAPKLKLPKWSSLLCKSTAYVDQDTNFNFGQRVPNEKGLKSAGFNGEKSKAHSSLCLNPLPYVPRLHIQYSFLPYLLFLATERALQKCWKFSSISHLQFLVLPYLPMKEGSKLVKQAWPNIRENESKSPHESNLLPHKDNHLTLLYSITDTYILTVSRARHYI